MSDDEVTYFLVSPKPEFRDLSEQEVLAAVKKNRSKKHRLIASEVTRLVEEYIANFRTYVAAHGKEPFLLEITVRSPIEKVAVRLMMSAVGADVTQQPTLH